MLTINNNWRGNPERKPLDFNFFARRDLFVSGPEGFTIMDLDNIVRWHGPNFNTDSIGFFMIVERKTYPVNKNKTFDDIPFHEKMKLCLIDKMLTLGNYGFTIQRYKGCFLVWSDKKGFSISNEFQINGIDVTQEVLVDFYNARAFEHFKPFTDWIIPGLDESFKK